MEFNVASATDLRKGRVTDIYFERVRSVLEAKGVDARFVGEVRASSLPSGWPWAVLAGLDELVALTEGLPLNVSALPEGTLFGPEVPVVTVAGGYRDFAVYETALLGVLCQASGIATMAARCKLAAGDRPLYSFGARRMHPAIAPMIERNAFVGGCDGVAVSLSAKRLGIAPVGTMAHAFILVMGDPCEAYRAFDEVIDPAVPRIALVDTFEDEKFGALTAVSCLGDHLTGIRLDTPRSRRGDFGAIIDEVRWELDRRGFAGVTILVSGGLDEEQIQACGPGADGFGVGTAISNAPVVDFSFDLVEVDGEPRAKRGKRSGTKQVWSCLACGRLEVTAAEASAPRCACHDEEMSALLTPLLAGGSKAREMPGPVEVRAHVLEQLALERRTLG